MGIDRAPFNALIDDDGSGTTGTIWNKTQIANVILNPTDAAISSNGWLPWTPIWTTTGGAHPAIGNGVLTGRYTVIGKTVVFELFVKLGSTTAGADSTPWLFTLPVPENQSTYGVSASSFRVWMYRPGSPITGATTVPYGTQIQVQTFDGRFVDVATPWAWGADSMLAISGSYEAS